MPFASFSVSKPLLPPLTIPQRVVSPTPYAVIVPTVTGANNMSRTASPEAIRRVLAVASPKISSILNGEAIPQYLTPFIGDQIGSYLSNATQTDGIFDEQAVEAAANALRDKEGSKVTMQSTELR